MKFTLTALTTAALALVASSAAIEQRHEGSHPLPARFAMYVDIPGSKYDGHRIRHAAGNLYTEDRQVSKDGVFINSNGRVALDPAVFPDPGFPVPANKNTAGTLWVLMFDPTISRVTFGSSYYVGLPPPVGTINPSPAPIVNFVMDGDHMLRSVKADGTLQNLLISCSKSDDINMWTDGIGYMDCVTANFRIVEL